MWSARSNASLLIALTKMIREDPALLECTVQIGQGLAAIALRAAAFLAKHAEALAAARQQVGRMLKQFCCVPNTCKASPISRHV